MELKELTEEEWGLIIEGLDNLKNKDMTGEMLDIMLEGMFKPKEDDPEEEKREWDEKRRMRRMEKDLKEEEKKKLIRKLELLKAKILLMTNELV